MRVALTRTGLTAVELRRLASQADEAAVVRRLLALASVLDGASRADAARLAGMDRQTLRDWIHRYNAEGLAGLGDRHGGGVKRRLSSEQEAQVAAWMRAGANSGVMSPAVPGNCRPVFRAEFAQHSDLKSPTVPT